MASCDFRNGTQAVEFFGEGAVIANHQDIVVPAALQGLGVFYAYDDEGIAAALADGRLKRVLADWSPTVPGLYLYYSSRRHLLPALRAFIDCLLDRDR
ncbi:MAG: LysR substrate-binding domain-containing protein [Stenotrophomonas sp.]|nr:LysR substrate-binding domain-containing protein [Stenotrophomonas sp.]